MRPKKLPLFFYLSASYLLGYAVCAFLFYLINVRVISRSVRTFDREDAESESQEYMDLLRNKAAGDWLAEEAKLPNGQRWKIEKSGAGFGLAFAHPGGGVVRIDLSPEELRALADDQLQRLQDRLGQLAQRLFGLEGQALCAQDVGEEAVNRFAPGQQQAGRGEPGEDMIERGPGDGAEGRGPVAADAAQTTATRSPSAATSTANNWLAAEAKRLE